MKETITPAQKQRKLPYQEADAQVLCATVTHVMAQLYSSSHALLL